MTTTVYYKKFSLFIIENNFEFIDFVENIHLEIYDSKFCSILSARYSQKFWLLCWILLIMFAIYCGRLTLCLILSLGEPWWAPTYESSLIYCAHNFLASDWLFGYCKRHSDWLNFRHFPGFKYIFNLAD